MWNKNRDRGGSNRGRKVSTVGKLKNSNCDNEWNTIIFHKWGKYKKSPQDQRDPENNTLEKIDKEEKDTKSIAGSSNVILQGNPTRR